MEAAGAQRAELSKGERPSNRKMGCCMFEVKGSIAMVFNTVSARVCKKMMGSVREGVGVCMQIMGIVFLRKRA